MLALLLPSFPCESDADVHRRLVNMLSRVAAGSRESLSLKDSQPPKSPLRNVASG